MVSRGGGSVLLGLHRAGVAKIVSGECSEGVRYLTYSLLIALVPFGTLRHLHCIHGVHPGDHLQWHGHYPCIKGKQTRWLSRDRFRAGVVGSSPENARGSAVLAIPVLIAHVLLISSESSTMCVVYSISAPPSTALEIAFCSKERRKDSVTIGTIFVEKKVSDKGEKKQ